MNAQRCVQPVLLAPHAVQLLASVAGSRCDGAASNANTWQLGEVDRRPAVQSLKSVSVSHTVAAANDPSAVCATLMQIIGQLNLGFTVCRLVCHV